MAQFTSGLFTHLGKTPTCPVWHLPKVFICHWFLTKSSHCRYNPQWAIMPFSLRTPANGGSLPVSLGVPWYLSTIRTVSCHIHDSIKTLLSYQPEGLGQSTEVQKWHCFSPNPDWGMYSRGQSIWPLHNVGTPLSSQGLYHWGGG